MRTMLEHWFWQIWFPLNLPLEVRPIMWRPSGFERRSSVEESSLWKLRLANNLETYSPRGCQPRHSSIWGRSSWGGRENSKPYLRLRRRYEWFSTWGKNYLVIRTFGFILSWGSVELRCMSWFKFKFWELVLAYLNVTYHGKQSDTRVRYDRTLEVHTYLSKRATEPSRGTVGTSWFRRDRIHGASAYEWPMSFSPRPNHLSRSIQWCAPIWATEPLIPWMQLGSHGKVVHWWEDCLFNKLIPL